MGCITYDQEDVLWKSENFFRIHHVLFKFGIYLATTGVLSYTSLIDEDGTSINEKVKITPPANFTIRTEDGELFKGSLIAIGSFDESLAEFGGV